MLAPGRDLDPGLRLAWNRMGTRTGRVETGGAEASAQTEALRGFVGNKGKVSSLSVTSRVRAGAGPATPSRPRTPVCRTP